MLPTQEGYTILELVPAFGRLFASVGNYMENSLYSYYAAELIPYCRYYQEGSCQETTSSFDFKVRLFSNMSRAGNYWPDETRQRITLISDGIFLSHYSGNGAALVSKDKVLLNKNDSLPSLMPYTTDELYRMFRPAREIEAPKSLTGDWIAQYLDDGSIYTLNMSIDADGVITFLRSIDDDYPPLLLKGVFFVSEDDSSLTLCYLMSSPSSGTMPYSGCVIAEEEEGALIISHPPMDRNDLVIPDNNDRLEYWRVQ